MKIQNTQTRYWFLCLIVALLVLSLKKFGAYSDLLCRGSAPLMFLLLVFMLQALKHYWRQQHYAPVVAIVVLLLMGSGSALLQFRTAYLHRDEINLTGDIVTYSYASENLGADDSVFNRYLRRAPGKERIK